MEAVLNAIAVQAGLERVLFTPAMKQYYFEMAVAAGGKTQFKHVDSIRAGINYATDKAQDKKRTLVICSVVDLIYAYDLLLMAATKLHPIVIIAVLDPIPEKDLDHSAFTQFGSVGCVQFITHTQQDLYDHLLLSYMLPEQKNLPIPSIIFQTQFKAPGSLTPKEEVDLGAPLSGFAPSKKTKGLDFDAALQSLKQKQEKKTLAGIYATLLEDLQSLYTQIGYECPSSGLPIAGQNKDGDGTIITLLPVKNEQDQNQVLRPYCYRPFYPQPLVNEIISKKGIAVIEPKPVPGNFMPPFFSSMIAASEPLKAARLPLVTQNPWVTSDMLDQAETLLQKSFAQPAIQPTITELDV